MPSFPDGGTITTAGLSLRAKVESGTKLKLLNCLMGDGVAAEGTELYTLTGLVSQQASWSVASAVALGDGVARVRTNIKNDALSSGFYARECGITADDPDDGEILYCYAAADPGDWIPDASEAFQQIFDMLILSGNATSITVNIDASAADMTLADMQDHENKKLDPTDTNKIKNRHISNAQGKFLYDHVYDGDMHVTAQDKASWDGHVDNEYLHVGPNLLINPNFDVWQLGTSVTNNTTDYHADQWIGRGTMSRTVSYLATGVNYGLLIEKGPSSIICGQPIELADAGKEGIFYSGAQVTLSFTAKADVEAKVYASLRFRDSATLSTNEVVAASKSFVASTAKTNHTITFTISAAAAATNTCMVLHLSNSDGDISELYLSGFKLEPGYTKTPNVPRSVTTERLLCQRYYQKSYRYGVSPGTVTVTAALFAEEVTVDNIMHNLSAQFVPEMRATPAVTVYDPVTGASGYAYDEQSGGRRRIDYLLGLNEKGFSATVFGSNMANTGYVCQARMHYVADARL